jgi:FKBP-type peptidyl-prolyl cis-trans isomerase (trigger factor)
MDSYLQMENKTADTFREETRERVVHELKMGLVLNELSKLERLDVSQIEILERAKAIAELSGAGDKFWQSVLSSDRSRATIGSDILTDKIFSRLAAIARGEASEPDAEPEVEEVTGETVAADDASSEEVVPSDDVAPSEDGVPEAVLPADEDEVEESAEEQV